MRKNILKSKVLVMLLVALMLITSLTQVANANSENIGQNISENVSRDQTKEIRSERLKGNNRFETAIEISKEAYDKSDTVILASSNGEADALTGTILVADKKAPLLLIQKDRVPVSVLEEIKRLGAENIYILGGTGAVSESVKDSLSKNYKVKRISGKNREETAIKIADQVEGKTDEYFLALGYGDLADALAIGPVSGIKKTPILLTQKDKIPTTTLEHIRETKPSKITIVGGTTAIGKEIEDMIQNQIPGGTEIDRVSGSNRIDTSVQIAKKYYSAKESDNKVILANGISIADALVGGHLAAKTETPIILTSSNRTNQTANKYIADLKADVIVLGGDKAINESTVKQMIKEINAIIKSPTPPIETPGDDENKPVEPPLNINPDKIMNRKDLIKYLEYAVNDQHETIEITYYGEDFTEFEMYEYLPTFEKPRSLTVRKIWKDGVYQKALKIVYKPAYPFWYEGIKNKYEVAFIEKEISRILEENITPHMSEFEKVRVLYDYIYNNTTYSKDTIGSEHSPYTLFKEKKGVCAAYARAYSRLMSAIGIDNMYISGQAINNGNNNGAHAWNKVKVDGVWYNIDPTWGYSYRHFLKSDEVFYKMHTPYYIGHPSNGFTEIPESNNTQYDHLINKY